MKPIVYIYILFSLFLITNQALAQEYIAKDGYVKFVSRAPFLEFTGESDKLAGLINLEEARVDFFVDLNTMDTGIGKRNSDMRNTYLETNKYPFAEFTGNLVTPFDPDKMQSQPATVEGTFSIHGVDREIKVNGTLEPHSNGIKLEADWIIRLEDYDIERPGIVFYELAEEQNIHISILLKSSEN
jgi:polyisoprenoid-binding protein YceI